VANRDDGAETKPGVVERPDRSIALVDHLRALPAETPWVEFKRENIDPDGIGLRISALSNSARLADQHFAYLVWGIADKSHDVVGTTFEPSATNVQREPFDFWLAKRLQPSINFHFKIVDHPDGRVVVLEIPAATVAPVEFNRTAYIRVKSATPRLADQGERQRALWAKLQPFAWETGVALEFISGDEVLELLDYPSYFDLTKQPLPDNRSGIFEKLSQDRLIAPDVGGYWNVLNLGAILFSRQLSSFERIGRKAVRLVQYRGTSRADEISNRRDGQFGYANGFLGLITYINGLLPKNEFIGQAFREERPMYPEIAIRELIANALIDQELTITGAGPTVEIFSDRIEITNPGIPLIDPKRFIDLPPRSRNETLASLMRRMRICEEQGSGVDKVIRAAEMFQLPAPDFRIDGDNTKVVLFAYRSFAEMTGAERVRACYQHAGLRFLTGEKLTNSSLRERLGIADQNAAQVSRIIREALDEKLIKLSDPDSPRAGYVPFWA
jgi:ATP-dependent DNA helicase RecG